MNAFLSKTEPPLEMITSGKVGEELIVLTHSELRKAERITSETSVNTADGVVSGGSGDYVVYTPGGEGYPVLKSIFHGAYEILGDVGGYVVGRRLIQVRRAWPIVSDYVEFNYANDRGMVTQSRGGWIYRSDDEDYGLINADENLSSHSVVGSVGQLQKYDWQKRLSAVNHFIVALPPVLSLLALLAFVSLTGVAGALWPKGLGTSFLVAEGILLVTGLSLVAWSRREGWVLRAAFQESQKLLDAFQVAADMLGQKRSELFPSMTIWRAAQSEHWPDDFRADHVREFRNGLNQTISEIQKEVRKLRHREHLAEKLVLVSAFAVIVCIALILTFHAWQIELFAIWLPSLIGAIETAKHQRQVNNRIESGKQFIDQLEFVRHRVQQWSPTNGVTSLDDTSVKDLAVTLRLVCKIIGDYSQHQIRYAMKGKPEIPV